LKNPIHRIALQSREKFPAERTLASVASMLALALLVFSTLVFNQRLHGEIHDGEHSADHSCALTIFASGQVDAAGPPAIDVSRRGGDAQYLSVSEYRARAESAATSARAPPSGYSH
jgi:hypothetical protein